ncbi:MAG: SPOR domain-containing protein [Gammaproteobacteria bacterium]|nr:SPOR domain-containing protein [Gammaproteobacteria bacterium]
MGSLSQLEEFVVAQTSDLINLEVHGLNQGVKQRIVGTVVLLALALIFLPIIFDGEGSYQAPVSSRIPETPIISILPEPIQSRPVIVGNVETIEPEVVTTVSLIDEVIELVEAPVVASATEDPLSDVGITESAAIFNREVPQLSDAGLPQGWVVRLGSFSDSENASKLVTRLQDAGYKAYSRAMRSDQGALTGVYVGPWLDRGQVNEYQQKLQAEFSLAGLVVRYELERL